MLMLSIKWFCIFFLDLDKFMNFVLFKIIVLLDEIVSLLVDGWIIIFNELGEYYVDVEFIMDIYFMDGF